MSTPPMELRRPKQAPPTESGYYYGKASAVGWNKPHPLYVYKIDDDLYVEADPHLRDIAYYDWYGPVPTCVEASLPK